MGSQARVIMSFQPMKNVDTDFEDVLEELEAQEYQTSDLSKNELAKVHARHMAGGRASAVNERLFRFEFPESPGALKKVRGVRGGGGACLLDEFLLDAHL